LPHTATADDEDCAVDRDCDLACCDEEDHMVLPRVFGSLETVGWDIYDAATKEPSVEDLGEFEIRIDDVPSHQCTLTECDI
jgi:hypothetical protein